jgi:ApbE superfamily uncharacterized protein (UPF0280 family)
MSGPAAQRLAGGRLHLSHGPIDVVLQGFGPLHAVHAAETAAALRFRTILDELVAELPELRRPVAAGPFLQGAVARRMRDACAPFAAEGTFVTSMAAVAGAVADELLITMRAAAPDLTRAYVNDGGDIAVFAAPGEVVEIGMVGDPAPAAAGGADGTAVDGALRIGHGMGIGGVATSGRHGRSFSLGIADAVTVLARDAATADAAATLIANAVDLDSPAITRAPAASLDPDSDLGDRLVTVACGPLAAAEVAAALEAGAARAEAWVRAGLIHGAALRLAGQARIAGHPFPALPPSRTEPAA